MTDRPTDPSPPDPPPGTPPPADAQRHDRRMLEVLVCPATRAPLTYDPARQELVSRAAHLAYPIRDGIPIMLAREARDVE